uniref:Xylulose kinase-1 n=1 Tax=Tanacetum cinerariifolium TaxID=118510 RepID=A0A6L2JBS3_TANCI|nr:xylulose kinase-1 [Tanacetum cinerariifolium]
MVAYLTKSDSSEGFNQVIDFLNASYIKYALTINPHIYVSCIKQFWNIVVVKQTNDVTRLQALVDKKKVMITEATIRDALRLDDAKGVDCLPNEEIFAEFLVRNVDISSKFYMYPRFIQLIVKNQLGDLSTHTTKYISLALTQKVFANMRRVGKGFSRVETPLFECMIVAGVIEEEGDVEERVEHLEYDKVAQALEIKKLKKRVKKLEKGNKVKVLKLRRLQKVETSQRIDISDDTVMEDASNQGRMIDALDSDAGVALMDENKEQKKAKEDKVAGNDQVQGRQAEIYKIDMDHASKVLSMQEDELEEVQEVVEVVTTAKLITEVVTAASESVTATSTIISAAEPQVPAATINVAPVRVAVASTRRRKGVVIRDPEEESTIIKRADTKSKDKGKGIMVEEPKPLKKKQQVEMDEEYARKLHVELNKDIDWDVAIDHVKQKAKEDPAVQRYQVMKKRPQTEAQAQKNMIMYLKNVAGFRLDYFKGMSYDDIRPIFEAKFNSNIAFLLKTKEQMEEEDNRVIQSINETPAQKAAKRRKLNKELEDLKRHLEIVPDKDDDIYTEATPLARKVPIVDYEIIHLNNKPYYKIIRADGTHQLFISFLTLLKNFDKEDLEALWNLVKERFSTSKPKNFSDDFLLNTLGAMFERPYGQVQVWKSQRSVHSQAKRFTLDQMLNAVRLRVEEQSEMSLELLRFTRQQHQEGQLE